MISIHGTPGTQEYVACERLRKLILQSWPDSGDAGLDDIRLVPSAKTYGQRVQDIDVILIGALKKPRPVESPDAKPSSFTILSFFWTIELKSHPRVDFEGGKVYVEYAKNSKRHDASEQSEQQKYSVLGYLKANGITNLPRVVNFIWLSHVNRAGLPTGVHNIFGADDTWQGMLTRCLSLEKTNLDKYERTMIQAIFPQTKPQEILDSATIFTRKLVATPLNRQKVEMISAKLLEDQQYSEKMGQQFLAFRGRGGTGKTIKLLRLAYDLYISRASKVLILTYNLALVADIKRLFAIMGIPQTSDMPSVHIASIHSYLYHTLKDLGLDVAPKLFLQNFDRLKKEALALEAINSDDIEHWDFVLIDEAQDWPPDERDLLFKIYSPLRIIVADGIDQLVRGSRPLNWPESVGKHPKQVVPLRKSLRLKANLCRFANEFASDLGYNGWKLDVAEELHGGRIIVVVGPLESMQGVVDECISDAHRLNNSPVDMLVCCPPRLAAHEKLPTPQVIDDDDSDAAKSKPKLSALAKTLITWGHEVWDGTSSDVRRSFASEINQLRLVQYESCRGLEGWTVFCFSLDSLYDYKIQGFEPTKGDKDLFVSDDDAARRFAQSWLMIPLTRAIDTIVLHVTDAAHPVTQALRATAKKMPGAVHWHES